MGVLIRLKDFLISHIIFIIGFIFMFIVGYAVAGLSRSSPYEEILNSELSKYSKGKWVVKINEMPLGESYIDKRVELYKKHKSTDTPEAERDIRDKMIKRLIDNHIVLEAAMRSGVLSGKDAKDAQEFLWLYLERAMVNYYLDFLVNSKRTKKINISNKRIEKFYDMTRDLFDKESKKKSKFFNIVKRKQNELNERLEMHNRSISRESELERLKIDKKIVYNKSLFQ